MQHFDFLSSVSRAQHQDRLTAMDVQNPSRSTVHSKPMGPHVKRYLEQWYQRMGMPKTIAQADKDAILSQIKNDNIEPTGISLNQLNTWLSQRRRKEKVSNYSSTSGGPYVHRRRPTGFDILFPNLTGSEISNLQILVSETPDPSPDLIAVWAHSSSLPNLTVEDADRFVKYTKARSASPALPSSSQLASPYEDVDMEDASPSENEGALQDHRDAHDHTHLPTPTSTSPEPGPYPLKLDPSTSPTIPLLPDQLDVPSPSVPFHMPVDPRAIIEMLRSQLSPAELRQLLQEGSSDDVPSSVSLAPSINKGPRIDLPNPRPSDQPTSPTARQMSHPPTSAHIATSESLAPVGSFTSVPGSLPLKMLDELAEIFHQRVSAAPRAPQETMDLLDHCQTKADKLLVALERGELRDFGLLPSRELEAIQLGAPLESGGAIGPPKPP